MAYIDIVAVTVIVVFCIQLPLLDILMQVNLISRHSNLKAWKQRVRDSE